MGTNLTRRKGKSCSTSSGTPTRLRQQELTSLGFVWIHTPSEARFNDMSLKRSVCSSGIRHNTAFPGMTSPSWLVNLKDVLSTPVQSKIQNTLANSADSSIRNLA